MRSTVSPFNIRFFLIVAVLVLIVAAGWSRRVFTDDGVAAPGRLARGWVVAIGVVLLGYALLAVVANAGAGFGLVALALLSTLVVAAFEELLFRGVLIGGFRASRWSEVRVWLFSSILFALPHVFNTFSGAELVTSAIQVVFAFGAGSTLYLARRVSRGLWLPIVLHFFNNFGVLSAEGIDGKPADPSLVGLSTSVYLVVGLVLFASFVIALIITRREGRAVSTQA